MCLQSKVKTPVVPCGSILLDLARADISSVFFTKRRKSETGHVGVLNWQLRQRHVAARAEGVVEQPQFAEEHAYRSGIGNDVVQVQRQHMAGHAELDQHRPHRQIARQAERTRHLLLEHAPQFGLAP